MTFQVSPLEAIAEQRRQAFDVAVVDMRMPVMSGVDLIKALTAVSAATTGHRSDRCHRHSIGDCGHQ